MNSTDARLQLEEVQKIIVDIAGQIVASGRADARQLDELAKNEGRRRVLTDILSRRRTEWKDAAFHAVMNKLQSSSPQGGAESITERAEAQTWAAVLSDRITS